ncbi:putative phosphotransferase enzyme family protein [Lyophyllum shimeji]|uniref:Phosphotransferase enzyme family protein n=1 Tax=Lyophyllum shimeji TaxID=47721 RepID=A0A9P3PXR0_LYOSH|nr:putative phosphotransferase enzyme family protein [Lyophyllum shimeji]
MVDTPNTYDLTTVAGVHAYIATTPFASSAVTILSGGTGNFAYRIHLDVPFQGQETLVLKHAEPYVKNYRSMPFSLDRQRFEYEAMTRIKAWLPTDSLVTVPTIYKFDTQHNVIIMEDCGPGTLTLKDFLREGRASSTPDAADLAEIIGASLGRFIGAMHAWSRADPDGMLSLFAENTQALQLSPWATYGRVVQTLRPGEGDDVPPALADPPFAVRDADVDVVRKVAGEMSAAMMAARDIFVMGDFWPGNVMVTLDSNQQLRRLYILDWELAKPGLPGVELGQFCAEMHLLQRFVPVAQDAASTVLNAFLRAYAKAYAPDVEVARNALVHWGTHLVVWTPRVPWGDKETTRKVVEEGLQIILGAAGAKEDELRRSLVGPLVSA